MAPPGGMCRKWDWRMSLRDPIFAQFSVGVLNFYSTPPSYAFCGNTINEGGYYGPSGEDAGSAADKK